MRFPGDERVRRMSLIGKGGGKSVRTAHLPTVGSHASRALPRCTRSCSRGRVHALIVDQ